MRARQPRRPRPPLGPAALDELALAYVARFATSRFKLIEYLRRKLRERGWDGEGDPALAAIAERLSRQGYIDDSAFAVAKARSLGARGYGAGRVRQSLRSAGIAEDDGAAARAVAEEGRIEAALRFARRRRLGPFASAEADRAQREKWLAAMLRAGHGLDLSRRIVHMPRGIEPDPQQLADTCS